MTHTSHFTAHNPQSTAHSPQPVGNATLGTQSSTPSLLPPPSFLFPGSLVTLAPAVTPVLVPHWILHQQRQPKLGRDGALNDARDARDDRKFKVKD